MRKKNCRSGKSTSLYASLTSHPLFALLGNTTSDFAPERGSPFFNGNTVPIKPIFTSDLRSQQVCNGFRRSRAHVSLFQSLRKLEVVRSGIYVIWSELKRARVVTWRDVIL